MNCSTSIRLPRSILGSLAVAALAALSACTAGPPGPQATTSVVDQPSESVAAPPSPAQTASSTAVAATPKGVSLDEQGGGAGAQLCQLITTTDVEAWLGSAVGKANVVAPLDSGCQWVTTDQKSTLMIQVMPADYYSPSESRKGFKKIVGVGDDAFSSAGMFGDFVAMAVVSGQLMIAVSVEAPSGEQETAAAVLTDAFPLIVVA